MFTDQEQIDRFNDIISNLLHRDSVSVVLHDRLGSDTWSVSADYDKAVDILCELFFHVANTVALNASRYSYDTLNYLVLQIAADIAHKRDHCFSDMFDGYASAFQFKMEEIDFTKLSKNKFSLVVVFTATMAILDALKEYSDSRAAEQIGNIVINELINAKIYN